MSDQPHGNQNLEQQIPGFRTAVSALNNVTSDSGYRVATIVLAEQVYPPTTAIFPTRIEFVRTAEQIPALAATAEDVQRWAPPYPTAQEWSAPRDDAASRTPPEEPAIGQHPDLPLRSKRASTSMLEGESDSVAHFGKRKRFSDPSSAAAPSPSGAFWGTVLEERPDSSEKMTTLGRGPFQLPLVGPSTLPSPPHMRTPGETRSVAGGAMYKEDDRLQRFPTFPALRLRSPTGARGGHPVLPSLQDPAFGASEEVRRDRFTSPLSQQGRQLDRRFLRRTASQILGRLSPFGPPPSAPAAQSPPSTEGQLYRPVSSLLPSLFGPSHRATPAVQRHHPVGDTAHSSISPPGQVPLGQELPHGTYGPTLTHQSVSRSASGSGVSHAQPSRTTGSPQGEGAGFPSAGSSRGKRGRRGGMRADREQFFECDLCDSKFRRKSDKNRHVRVVHEKSRPFMCPVCEKTFGEKSNMLKHKASVHDDVRTFRCPYCDASFSQRGLCDNHVRTVHDKKQAKYFCEHCGLPFSRKVQLNDHYDQVHPEFASTYGRYYPGSSGNAPGGTLASGLERDLTAEDRALVGDTARPEPQVGDAVGVFPAYLNPGPVEGRTTPSSAATPRQFSSPQLRSRSDFGLPEASGGQRSFQGDSSS